jgi:homoserine O-acetyltransferase
VIERLDSVTLESGATLAPVDVAYADYGPRDAPVILIHHALTGDAEAIEWWDTLVGPGRAVDTDRFRVICSNLLGGCKGTTGPSSIDPATGEPYGLDFPLFTVRDLVTVQRALLRSLGVAKVHAAVGGSLGGMQALQWWRAQTQEVERAVVLF